MSPRAIPHRQIENVDELEIWEQAEEEGFGS